MQAHRILDLETVKVTLCDSELLGMELPERRYWQYWQYVWKGSKPTVGNIVKSIIEFTLYIVCVCDTCVRALRTELPIEYRIHQRFGVQERHPRHGWLPDPAELGRVFQMAAARQGRME
jgi:hypothetical protein